MLVPLVLERAGADPAVASSVFVTMITDSMGFLRFPRAGDRGRARSAKPLRLMALVRQLLPRVPTCPSDQGRVQLRERRNAAARIAAALPVARCGSPPACAPSAPTELIGGSLHWIVKHRLVACQRILRFEDRRRRPHRHRLFGRAVELIVPVPQRAHQGWRYLEKEMRRRPMATAPASPSFRRGFTAAWPPWR